MKPVVLVQVPGGDATDLDELAEHFTSPERTTVEPFDGEAVVQAVLALTGVSIPALGAWLTARVQTRKNFKVVSDGVELSGYSVEEVRQILQVLEDRLSDEQDESGAQ